MFSGIFRMGKFLLDFSCRGAFLDAEKLVFLSEVQVPCQGLVTASGSHSLPFS